MPFFRSSALIDPPRSKLRKRSIALMIEKNSTQTLGSYFFLDPKLMASSKSEIKFSEWRPIGVCDQGGRNQQKVVMFNEKDLTVVTSPHVTRQNWKTHSDVTKLIHNYAKKVAKISQMAKKMERPVIADIKLVGMVLNYKKTPTLNQESSEGKVQLFQIEFKDLGKKKPWLWKVILGMLCLIILGFGIYAMSQWSIGPLKGGSVRLCSTKRSSQAYASHLNQTRINFENYLEKLPYNYKKSCYFSKGSVNSLEQQLISCYLTLQRAESTLHPAPTQVLKTTNRCVVRVCERDLSHLQNYCKQLNF